MKKTSFLAISVLAALAARTVQAETSFDELLKQAQAAQAKPAQAKPAPAATAPAAPAKVKAKPKPQATAVPTAASPTAQALTSTADPIAARLQALESFQQGLERFKFEAFSHLRFDKQDSRKVSGVYARRAEAKLSAKLFDGGSAVLGFDFVEGKLKDIGLEADRLPLWPGASDWTWKLQVGQFRQKFGIEPQTGSPKVWFAERALVYGGAQPLSPSVKLVGERAMGVHAIQKHKAGRFSYELGLSVVDDLSEDQAPGKNKVSGADAFPKQAADQDPSYCGRLGLGLALGSAKAGLGASYGHDSQNTVFLATRPADQRAEELSGFDASLELPELWRVQAEWVAADAIQGDLGLSLRREGWYVQQGLQVLRLFSATAPKLELLGRYESVMPNVHQGPALPRAISAATGGLKWNFSGDQQLLLQYTAYGQSSDFGSAAGNELWILQQQLSF